MSDCCNRNPEQAEEARLAACKECGQKGRAVLRVTPESLLLEERKKALGPSQYFFCVNRACIVVYFSNEDGVYFSKGDLRVRVGQKETEDPVSVCYCFGHTRASVWEEIRQTGQSTVEADIRQKVKSGLCACETNNPQGSCCLGQVGEAVKEGLARYGQPAGSQLEKQGTSS